MDKEKKNKDTEQVEDRSLLGQAYDAVKGEVHQIRTDVAEELQTYAKVGKFRLATGLSLAAKGALVGSVVPGKGTILGGVTGFVVGVVGAPRIEKFLDENVPESLKGKFKEAVIRIIKPGDETVKPAEPANDTAAASEDHPGTGTAPNP